MCVGLEIESYKICLYIVDIGTHVFNSLKTYIAGKKKNVYTI